MIMKTSPNDVSNQEILKELKKLIASDVSVRNELKKLTASDISIKEELQRLNEKFVSLDEKVDNHYVRLDSKIGANHAEIVEMINEFSNATDRRFVAVESEQVRMRSSMLTKGYLDDKMADLRVDISQNTKRQIEKALIR